MRSLRLVPPAPFLLMGALLIAGLAAAQQPQPLTMLPPDGRGLPRVAPAAQRPLTAAEAQSLIGKSVVTRDGEPAGEIRDFVLGGPDGRIDSIVLAQGGFLGIGTRVYAVPASALRVGAAQRVPERGQRHPMEVSIDLTARELADAPEFAYGAETLSLVRRR
ncbi:PRC-barrel domain-containing protein [Azospirillum sp. TSO22-1]|uniref:PRC-barrel domain-containing protein n=1 Tax=Azospirillum sp. TSO22-1 TaxID=716789 RepID=UPI000D65B86B|nr:PRC-barrel domain-containing protein [Azospirillum sp. TSO22-1]